jgi:hypothetical protein
MDQSDIDPFMDMYLILEALKAEDLSPALHWAAQHSSELEALGMSGPGVQHSWPFGFFDDLRGGLTLEGVFKVLLGVYNLECGRVTRGHCCVRGEPTG